MRFAETCRAIASKATAVWPDCVAILALSVESTLLGEGVLLKRPDVVFNNRFLIGDQGAALWVLDRMTHGAQLYRDVAYQYGPLTAYALAGAASLFGSTARTTVLWYQLLSVATVVSVYGVLRQYVSSTTALLVASLGALPLMQQPGGTLDPQGLFCSPHMPLERLSFLATLSLWKPPPVRSARHAAALGAALGIWQWVKFGGAFFALAAIVCLDAFALTVNHKRKDLRRWGISLLITLSTLGVLEAAQVVWAFAVLPSAVARDAVWPAYPLVAYGVQFAGTRAAAPRDLFRLVSGLWRFGSLPGRAMVSLLTVVMFAAGAGVLRGAITVVASRGKADFSEMRGPIVFLPLVFILLGSGTYFAFFAPYLVWWWALTLPAAPFLADAGRGVRLAFAAVTAGSLALNVTTLFSPQPTTIVPLSVPHGDTIYVDRDEALAFTNVGAVAKTECAEGCMIFVPPGATAAGLHALYDIPLGLRAYWYLPGFVRPYDEREIRRRLRDLGGLLVLRRGQPPPDPCAWVLPRVFSQRLCTRLRRALNGPPRNIAAAWWMFPVRHGSRSRGIERSAVAGTRLGAV